MNIDFIILAAGKGTRMGGDSPKVLANLAGKPMLQHLIDTVNDLPKSKTSVIVGYKAKEVEDQITSSKTIDFVNQKKQLGTAHAVKQALPHIRKNSISVILYGDAPLVTKATLKRLINTAQKGNLSLLTFIKVYYSLLQFITVYYSSFPASPLPSANSVCRSLPFSIAY